LVGSAGVEDMNLLYAKAGRSKPVPEPLGSAIRLTKSLIVLLAMQQRVG
jgi:hypothetical protein